MSRYYIGIDGGGTKTEAVLCDESGHMLSRAVTGPSNFSSFDENGVVENLRGAVGGVLEGASLSPSDISSIYAGLAGGITYHDRVYEVLKGLFGASTIISNAGDAVNVLSTGLLLSDGVGIISGTGSTCFVRKNDALFQIGGWGYLVDKRGSGFDIGRDIIGAVLRSMDGRGGDTVLREMYIKKCGCLPDEDMERIYREGVPYIASLAPMAFEAFDKGDSAAKYIIDRNMGALALCIKAAAEHFSESERPFHVALGGGIFKHKPALDSLRRQSHEAAILDPLPTEPVFGAVVEAMKYDKVHALTETRDAFIATYKK